MASQRAGSEMAVYNSKYVATDSASRGQKITLLYRGRNNTIYHIEPANVRLDRL